MGEIRELLFLRSIVVLLLCVAVVQIHPSAQHASHDSSRVAFSHPLPALNGEKLAINVVEVSYAHGEASPAHSHPCPVIGYVVDGEIRSQVGGQPEVVYKVGDSFYEAPNGIHEVSANASRTKPAKLLAFFVCDHAAPLSVPAEPPRK